MELTEEPTVEPTEEPTLEPTSTPEPEETEDPADAPRSYAIDVDLTGMRAPFSLRALLGLPEAEDEDAADPDATSDGLEIEYESASPEAPEEGDGEAEQREPATVGAEPRATAANTAPSEWKVRWNRRLLDVELIENDYVIIPKAAFSATEIAVEAGDTYTVRLLNWTTSYPAQRFESRLNDVLVKVRAGAGAFPEGTTMSVVAVEDEDTLNGLAGAVESDSVTVTRVHAVDITFYNADGEEIEPLKPISVAMFVEELTETQSAVVVHMDDNGDTEVVTATDAGDDAAETAEAETTASPTGDTVVEFDADAFSVYALLVTETLETRYISANGEAWDIRVSYTPEAEIPADAELRVSELEESSDEWLRCCADAVRAFGEQTTIEFARFFDIEIWAGDEKIEPAVPVDVTITYADALTLDENSHLAIVHFADEGTEVITDVTLDETCTEINYQQASFSVSGTIVQRPAGGWWGNAKNMVLVNYEGEDYIVLNDGTLEKLAKVNGNNVGDTVEADYPMFWRYDGSNIYHNYAAVGYGGLQLASAFYYRYLDANEPDALSEDTEDNTILVHETQYDVYDQPVDAILLYDNSRLQKPLAQIVYEEGTHHLHSESHPDWYIGVAEENGKLKLVGQQSSANAADIRFATVTKSDSIGTHGAKYNSVNHIDISVRGTAIVKVPLDYGTYYYRDKNGNTRTLVVNRDNPVNVTLTKEAVTVTPDDIRHASVTAYVEGANGKHEYKDDLFVISGYSQNASTEGLSTAQVRIEGVFKVADLSSVDISNADIQNNFDWRQRQDLRNALQNGHYNLDVIPDSLGDGNGNNVIRKLRLDNQVHYTVSTCKTENFPLKYNGFQLYASEDDLDNDENPLDTDAMVTLSSSFTYWDIKNECPILHWDVNNTNNHQNYWFQYHDAWVAGDIVLSSSDLGDGGSGMDFSLGDVTTIKDGTLAMQVTKYIVDKLGNRIYTWDETENHITVYEKKASDLTKPNPDANAVQGLHVDAFDESKASQPDYDGYYELHDKKITVGTDGMGTIYDFDVDPGMVYVREHTTPDELLQEIVDTNGKTWTYTETHLETEYVWRGDGIEHRNHFSKTYTNDSEAYNSIPEVLGYYNDVTGATHYNGYLSFVIYNVYEPGTTQVKVKKTWTHENGTVAEPPAGAEVTATIGRYKLEEDPDNPATGTLTINQTLTGESISNQDFHAVYRIKDGDAVIRTISYNPDNPNGMVVKGLPFDTYTVETESYVKGHETVDPPAQTITLSNAHPNETCNFTTQVKDMKKTKVKVKLAIKFSRDNNPIYHQMETYFDQGSKVIVNFTRPGWRHNFNMEIWVAGVKQTYTKPDGVPVDFPRINDSIEFTIPENWDTNRDFTVTIYHDWGAEAVIFGEIYADDTGSSAGTNSTGGRNYAPLSTRRTILAAQNPIAGIPAGIKDPEPPVPGRKYVVDTAFSKTVTLKGAPWEEILADLESVNEEGYPYLYYIKEVTEKGVTEGTVPTIVLDGDHVLGSTGDVDLPITNRVPDEPPKLHVKKLDGQGNPLTGATFNLYYKANDSENEDVVGSFTIRSTDGVYTTGGLEKGSYRLEEANAPTGFIKLDETITFTVDDDYKIVTGYTPEGVSFKQDTYTLEVVNKPEVDDGEIAVMKRWQNLDGTEAEADKVSVSITLRRTKVTPKSKKVHVTVSDPYTGKKGDATMSVNRDSILVRWNDGNIYKDNHNRLLYAVSDSNLTLTCVHEDGYVEWRIDHLNQTTSDVIEVQFKYNMEHDSYYGNRQHFNYLRDTCFRDLTPTISEVAGSASLSGEDYGADSFYQPVTLSALEGWQKKWKIGGTDSSHAGYDYPATDDSGLNYRYYVVENDTDGYAVTYTNNNGIETGVITVYNRKLTADLNIVKVDKVMPNQRLKDAEFKLYKLDAAQTGAQTAAGWTETTVTTDGNGEASFKGLVPGEYYRIQETGVPEGYILTGDGNAYIKVTTEGIQRIAFDGEKTPDQWVETGDDDMISLTASTLTVKNVSGVALPSTGGAGTEPYTVVGALLILGALALLIRKRCMAA